MTARLAVVALCLLAASGVVARASRSEPVPPREPLAAFPSQIGGWAGRPDQAFDARVLRILNVDEYVNRAYVSRELRKAVSLYIGYYRSQREGDTIHSPLNCMPGSGWEPTSKTRIALDLPDGSKAVVNDLVIEKGLDRQAVLYWYQSHGRIVASEYWGRAYLAFDALRLNRTDGSMVRVIAPIDDRESDGAAAAEQTAIAFARAMLPLLPRFLPN